MFTVGGLVLTSSKNRTHKNGYKYFFTNRVINLWNSRPDDIADAKSVHSFKNKIDSHFRDVMFDFLFY